MNKPRHIDLFSGIGGFALAAHWAGFTTKVFCEQDEFCKKVLSRHWPPFPIVSDIRDFDGIAYRGAELLTGGFPCQPFSCAGKRQGEADNRYLWPEMLRVISEARPHWIVGENVAGIINMALDDVLSDLENEGYTTQAFVIPACAVNAPHRRDRVWVVATDTYRTGWEEQRGTVAISAEQLPAECSRQTLSHAHRHDTIGRSGDVQMGRFRESGETENDGVPGRTQRATQPGFGERDDGLPGRLAGYWDGEWERGIPRIARDIPDRARRLKALGNSIVPQVAYQIIRLMSD